nr:hypothetical protein GCM10020185_40060 [Pseudomonas brassicacearum subsp. brassicacearum]
MLLVGISLFYMPSGFNAPRFVVHSWLCVLSRLVAVVFWIYLINTNNQGQVFVPMLMGDLSMFLILGVLLYLGCPAANRPLALLCAGWREWRAGWALRWQSHAFKVGTLVVLLVLGFIGYQTWYQMIREVPQPDFASDEDHYKYAAIGLGIEARIPYYLFAVLPQMCPEKNCPSRAATRCSVFLYENGNDLPIGMAKRQLGYPTVEPNCALCHTGSYRANASDVAVPVATAPANTLQLQAFQWFAYDCASDPKFTPDAVMAAINSKFQLGFFREAVQPLPDHPDGQECAAQAEAGLRLAEAASGPGARADRHLQSDQNGGVRLPG